MHGTRAESRATKAGQWLLALLIPASGLALGSVQTEVLILMSGVAALSCGLLWFERDEERTSRASRWVLLALAILLGMTILQAVAVPAALARAVAPANAEIWDRALSPLREPGPAWHSLSIAPAATRVEVLRGFFYGCVFLAALRVARRERGEEFLVRLVVFSTVLMAVAALAHVAVGAEKVFGVYRPRELHAYRTGRFAPLLNTNHLAAYLDAGACVALGALVSQRFMPRALSASALLVLAGTSVWQGSRGATGALLLGVLLTIALTLYTKRRFESARADAVVLGACAVAAAFMVSIALSDVAREHLISSDLTKVGVARGALSLVTSSPWLGVGRGGFETVFSSVRGGTTYSTFTHPEDIVIQWLVEWGAPVTLAGMGMLAWALRPHVVLRAVRPAVGAWVAVVTAILHDLVDYHFEVPGFVALAAVCVAVVVNGRASSRSSEQAPRRFWSVRTGAFVMVAGSAIAAVAAWGDVDHSLAEDRRALSAMAVEKSVSKEQFQGVLRAALLRYPAEPFLPLMSAVRAQFANDGSGVMPGISRALERSPQFGRAHFVLARSLAAGGHAAQARLEYRLAYEYDQQLRDQVVKEGVHLVVDADSALEMVPEGSAGVDMLEALVAEIAPRLPATAVILDAEIDRRSPGSVGPRTRRAEAALADASSDAPWCPRKSCLPDAIVVAQGLVTRTPDKCSSHALLARLRAANGEAARAVDGLEKALDSVSDRALCQREVITLALANGETSRADRALDRLVRSGCGAADECVDLYSWAGGMEESRAHYTRAVQLYKRVVDLSPQRDDLLEHIGELGSQRGVMPDALDAYRILATRHPEDARWPARIAELRAQANTPPAGLPEPTAP